MAGQRPQAGINEHEQALGAGSSLTRCQSLYGDDAAYGEEGEADAVQALCGDDEPRRFSVGKDAKPEAESGGAQQDRPTRAEDAQTRRQGEHSADLDHLSDAHGGGGQA